MINTITATYDGLIEERADLLFRLAGHAGHDFGSGDAQKRHFELTSDGVGQ